MRETGDPRMLNRGHVDAAHAREVTTGSKRAGFRDEVSRLLRLRNMRPELSSSAALEIKRSESGVIEMSRVFTGHKLTAVANLSGETKSVSARRGRSVLTGRVVSQCLVPKYGFDWIAHD
jgi:hypothetical protein